MTICSLPVPWHHRAAPEGPFPFLTSPFHSVRRPSFLQLSRSAVSPKSNWRQTYCHAFRSTRDPGPAVALPVGSEPRMIPELGPRHQMFRILLTDVQICCPVSRVWSTLCRLQINWSWIGGLVRLKSRQFLEIHHRHLICFHPFGTCGIAAGSLGAGLRGTRSSQIVFRPELAHLCREAPSLGRGPAGHGQTPL